MFSVYFAKCFRPARIISDHYKLNPVDLFPKRKIQKKEWDPSTLSYM